MSDDQQDPNTAFVHAPNCPDPADPGWQAEQAAPGWWIYTCPKCGAFVHRKGRTPKLRTKAAGR